MSNGGDDPWAKWRKPDGAPAEARAADEPVAKAEAKSEAKPEAKVDAEARPVASGTLTVNKAARSERPPVGRGRPGAPGSAGKSAWGKPEGRAGGERRSERKNEGDDRAPRRERSEGRPDSGEGGKRPYGRPAEGGRGRSGDAPRQPYARPSGDTPRQSYERPAGQPARKPYERPAASGEKREFRGEFRREFRGESVEAETRPTEVVAKPVRPPRDPNAPAPEGVRVSKVMSERGMCSRREADLWIERGWVFVDGTQVSELGSRINPLAEITISREAKQTQAKQVTILLNKPLGYVSGQPEPGCVPAVTLISGDSQVQQSGDPEFKPWMLRGLAPAGRLDSDSTGLLVFTQDGRVAKQLIGEDSDVEKEYLVRVEGELVSDGLKLLNHGLELDGKALRPARVKQLNEDQLHFILKEGKKRQIRRMCELVGLKVIGLKRVRIGRVKLGDLQIGQWRFLRADERF